MKQKETKDPIANEWQNGLKNDRGTIAMARTSAPNSATCQFFINVVDNGALDQPRGGAAYAVFGKVVHGMDTVDKIKKVKTGTKNGMGDVPTETVTITDASVIDANAKDLKPEYKDAIRKSEEEAKKAMKEQDRAWETAMDLVKSKGGDPTKGVKTDSGLWYTDIVAGTGAKPDGPTTTVEVHYTGWLVDGSKFDSSRDRGDPATFPLNRVIKGWTEGVGSMNIGTRRLLVIPADLAYGAAGRPSIPPNSTLVFDVELLSIK
jgi:FKBP-type peptidyl-prolyl cis-trans isomerase